MLAESCFLLQQTSGGNSAVLELVRRKVIEVRFSVKSHAEAVARLMKKYTDASMSLADACLLRMSEMIAESVVFTLDAHVTLYRRHGRQTVPLLMPHGRLR